MLRQERSAWLSLFILGLAITAFGVLSFILGVHRASGAFGLLGLLGLVPVLNRPGSGDNAPFDERDALIQANSVRIAYAVFWVVFVVASTGLWASYQSRGLLPVEILPLFPMVGWMVVTLVQSIATLVQYARGR
jgi:hypothetical protein